MGGVLTQVEELPENRVRLSVEVPREDMQHAVEHAASDLAATLRIPGFRKGKVPRPVLLARIGRERVMAEAVESHIGGWFQNAVSSSHVLPVSKPEYLYDLPTSDEEAFRFSATVAVQPKPEPADWAKLEVPYFEPALPADVVDDHLEQLAASIAPLEPVENRPAHEGDVLVVDLVGPSEAQRDYVVELGVGRLVEELEQAFLGLGPGGTKEVEYELADGTHAAVEVTVKEVHEKVLPPIDDELARAVSEFETLDQLRADIGATLHEQIEAELETQFRAEAADALVEASRVEVSGPLVQARARELLNGMARSLERRGVSVETYLAVSNQTPQDLQERLLTEAHRAVARELVLGAVADKLGLEVSDDEVRALIREQVETAGEEDAEELVEQIFNGPARESLREDLRLRGALDRVVGEVKRIPADLARAREKLWTPEKEKAPGDTKLWTPATTKEPA
jgi:trigger factor